MPVHRAPALKKIFEGSGVSSRNQRDHFQGPLPHVLHPVVIELGEEAERNLPSFAETWRRERGPLAGVRPIFEKSEQEAEVPRKQTVQSVADDLENCRPSFALGHEQLRRDRLSSGEPLRALLTGDAEQMDHPDEQAALVFKQPFPVTGEKVLCRGRKQCADQRIVPEVGGERLICERGQNERGCSFRLTFQHLGQPLPVATTDGGIPADIIC